MTLADFHAEQDGFLRITPEQASRFAKEVAGDFNPIHDPGARRFCVPGDLLFALVLARLGLRQRMAFRFAGMVGEGVALRFPATAEDNFQVCDAAGKEYLTVTCAGAPSRDARLIDDLTQAYVAFSGQTFPHILVPLMEHHQVMLNPERPLVIYESMTIDLDRLDFQAPTLELEEARLDLEGKRGDAHLAFRLLAAGQPVGRGTKTMVLSGLRPYDPEASARLVEEYTRRKAGVATP